MVRCQGRNQGGKEGKKPFNKQSDKIKSGYDKGDCLFRPYGSGKDKQTKTFENILEKIANKVQ